MFTNTLISSGEGWLGRFVLAGEKKYRLYYRKIKPHLEIFVVTMVMVVKVTERVSIVMVAILFRRLLVEIQDLKKQSCKKYCWGRRRDTFIL